MSINWLPLSVRKGLDTPKVLYEPYIGQPYGGFYHNNIILVVVHDEKYIPATIAHEYKHHIQRHTGKNFIVPNDVLAEFSKFSYNKAIRNYFRRMWWEMEALVFQEKYAPTEVGKFWLQGLVLPQRFDEQLEM